MGGYHKDALPPHHQLSEYTIHSILGYGGFGITYLARDNQLGSMVAIKEYLPQDIAGRVEQTRVLPNPDTPNAIKDYHWGLKEFLKEARALVQFKHPNIVRVLRYMEANGTAYMVMEYEKGESLSRYLKHHGRRLDEPGLLRVFLPVLNGLGAVHAAGMLHLDIKPDNIYLREDGTPMLIDFGSARQAAITGPAHAQRVTLTHGFAPVEQYPNNGTQGAWTDIYALGASMYFCINGKRPEVSINRYQTMLKHHVDPMIPAVKAGERRYSRYLLECVDWTLQIYARDRPQSARDLQDGLIGKGVPSEAKALRATPLVTPRKRDRHGGRFPRWAYVLLLVAGIGGAALAFNPETAKRLWAQSEALVQTYGTKFMALLKR